MFIPIGEFIMLRGNENDAARNDGRLFTSGITFMHSASWQNEESTTSHARAL
jgi:hypothetical protein